MRVRYFVNVIVNRGSDKLVKQEEFFVHNIIAEPLDNPPANLELGVEGKLGLSFELDRTKFHLEDCITGRVTFGLVKLKL